MGCGASSACSQAATRISFSQVVPDNDLQHKDAKQIARTPKGCRDVKTGWTETKPNQQDVSTKPVSSSQTERLAAEAALGDQPVPEGPALLGPSGDGCESGQDVLTDSKKVETLREVVPRPPTDSSDKEGRDSIKQKQEGLCLFASELIVSEPKSLITWNSYDFTPCAEDVKLMHSIPPCAPTHKRYLCELKKRLKQIAWVPEAFQENVMKSRDMSDWKAQYVDAQNHGKAEAQAPIGDSSRDRQAHFARAAADFSSSSSTF